MANKLMISPELIHALSNDKSFPFELLNSLDDFPFTTSYNFIKVPWPFITQGKNNNNLYTLQKMGDCKYNLEKCIVNYCSVFYPSVFTKNSLIYLQTLADISFGPSHYTQRSNLPSYLIVLTVSGSGILKYDDKTYTLDPGDFFFVDCMEPHSYMATSKEGWRYKLAHINGVMLSNFFSLFRTNSKYIFRFDDNDEMYKIFDNLFDKNIEFAPGNDLSSHSILTTFISKLAQTLPQFNADNCPVRIKEIQQWIASNIKEDISIDVLSQKFHLSKYHLCRIFKQYTGVTIHKYINSIRMERCIHLLTQTDFTISVISEELGFKNECSLYRMLKNEIDMSPAEYRRNFSHQ